MTAFIFVSVHGEGNRTGFISAIVGANNCRFVLQNKDLGFNKAEFNSETALLIGLKLLKVN